MIFLSGPVGLPSVSTTLAFIIDQEECMNIWLCEELHLSGRNKASLKGGLLSQRHAGGKGPSNRDFKNPRAVLEVLELQGVD